MYLFKTKRYLFSDQVGLKFGDEEGADPVEGERDGGPQRLALGREELHVQGPGQWADA